MTRNAACRLGDSATAEPIGSALYGAGYLAGGSAVVHCGMRGETLILASIWRSGLAGAETTARGIPVR